MSVGWASGSIPEEDAGPLGDMIAENNGESRFVCRLADHPGWLYKKYQSRLPIPGAKRLAALIELPQTMTPADKALVERQTSWPAARVTGSAGETLGVIMPEAPEKFSATRTIPATGRQKTGPLTIDLLASSEDKQEKLGLPRQSLDDRLAVSRSLVAVADLFERYELVYLDWSYANAFWSIGDHSVYVIDLDGASIGPRKQIQSPNWDDPLVSFGTLAGNESDRYRVALLVARCLTGLRPGDGDLDATLAALGGNRDPGFGWLIYRLRETLSAGGIKQRPSLSDLKDALTRPRTQETPPVSNPRITWEPIAPRGGPGRTPSAGTQTGTAKQGWPGATASSPTGRATGATVHTPPPPPVPKQNSVASTVLKGMGIVMSGLLGLYFLILLLTAIFH